MSDDNERPTVTDDSGVHYKPLYSRVNKRYDLANGLTTLYVQIVVPTEKVNEVKWRLNGVIDWFLSRHRLRGYNGGKAGVSKPHTHKVNQRVVVADSDDDIPSSPKTTDSTL